MAAIREYVCRARAGCSADRITSVERLVPGENNAIYKVTYRDRQGDANHVVVRIGSRGAAARLRAEREARVLRKVGGIAGPTLYDFRGEGAGLDGPVMCIEFIQGHHADPSAVGLGRLERLGRLVRWLHAQPVEEFEDWTPAGGMGLAAYVEERWQNHLAARLGAIRDPLPTILQKRLRAAVAVAVGAVAELKRLSAASDDRLVLLHGDIAGANLLWAPEPVLIDWEYARLGDPADEVAYVFTQNALTDLQQDAFWRGYVEPSAPRSLPDLTERVRYWMPITLLGSILWWLEAWSRAEAATADEKLEMSLLRGPDHYLDQASERLERFQYSPGPVFRNGP